MDKRNRDVGWQKTRHMGILCSLQGLLRTTSRAHSSPFPMAPLHWMFCENEGPTFKTLSSTILPVAKRAKLKTSRLRQWGEITYVIPVRAEKLTQ